MTQKQWENGYRTTMICIDPYERSVPTGQFFNQYYPEGISFHGVLDLINEDGKPVGSNEISSAFFYGTVFCGSPEQ